MTKFLLLATAVVFAVPSARAANVSTCSGVGCASTSSSSSYSPGGGPFAAVLANADGTLSIFPKAFAAGVRLRSGIFGDGPTTYTSYGTLFTNPGGKFLPNLPATTKQLFFEAYATIPTVFAASPTGLHGYDPLLMSVNANAQSSLSVHVYPPIAQLGPNPVLALDVADANTGANQEFLALNVPVDGQFHDIQVSLVTDASNTFRATYAFDSVLHGPLAVQSMVYASPATHLPVTQPAGGAFAIPLLTTQNQQYHYLVGAAAYPSAFPNPTTGLYSYTPVAPTNAPDLVSYEGKIAQLILYTASPISLYTTQQQATFINPVTGDLNPLADGATNTFFPDSPAAAISLMGYAQPSTAPGVDYGTVELMLYNQGYVPDPDNPGGPDISTGFVTPLGGPSDGGQFDAPEPLSFTIAPPEE